MTGRIVGLTFVGLLSVSCLHPRAAADSPPTEIPGVICRGQHLVVGINQGGGFGVGKENGNKWAGFQFPPGPQHESLAIFFWGEGWKISYKYREEGKVVDTTAWWQPEVGWPPPKANGFEPISARSLRDDDQECLYEVVVRTTDGRLQLTFLFIFRKAYPSVIVTTQVQNTSDRELFDIIYARTADFDIHQNTVNDWTSNDSAAFATGNNPAKNTPRVMMSIAGFAGKQDCSRATVFYAEESAWDDFDIRGPGRRVVKNRTPVTTDGHGSVHYNLYALRPTETSEVETVYSAAFTGGGPIILTPGGIGIPGHVPSAPKFEEADADKSGALSQREAAAIPGLDFGRADRTEEGEIGKEEYSRRTEGFATPTFEEADADKSGALSQREAAAIPGFDFGRADRSGDGKLDKDEFDAATRGTD